MAQPPRYHPGVVSRATIAAQREGKNPNFFVPHTIEAGDALELGDIYDPRPSPVSWQWSIDTSNMPYLSHIKSLGRGSRRLQYLADFMEVTTSPLKWEFVCDKFVRDERAERTRICVLDFEPGIDTAQTDISSAPQLRSFLYESQGETKPPKARLFIVEDLSRTVIESLGSHFDIDPLFFREHISDYLWYQVRDAWTELPDMRHVLKKRTYFNVRYLRPRFFRNEQSLVEARQQTGLFNVLRRLEAYPSRKPIIEGQGSSVGLLRTKAALWVRPNKDDESGVVAIMLVDPTITKGYPLWGGYNTFEQTPSMYSSIPEEPPRTSAFEDVIFWTKKMTDQDIANISHHPALFAEQLLCLVCSEWMILLRYVSTRIANVDWDLENPDFLKDPNCIESALRRLHPWRRSVPRYLEMISETIEALSRYKESSLEQSEVFSRLLPDFFSIQAQLKTLETQIDRLVAVASTTVSIEETRGAFRQNRDVVRLTYLAFIFFPLTFISSIFSMSSDLSSLKTTFYIYFPISIALTFITSILLVGPEGIKDSLKNVLKGFQNAFSPDRKSG
ncbi:hypothetical protein EV356DRAFT_496865 [Neofusicoccum parvum]|nr:hypothetical protein EV356DRAFT_496865 [Neofusicoccum parvum]